MWREYPSSPAPVYLILGPSDAWSTCSWHCVNAKGVCPCAVGLENTYTCSIKLVLGQNFKVTLKFEMKEVWFWFLASQTWGSVEIFLSWPALVLPSRSSGAPISLGNDVVLTMLSLLIHEHMVIVSHFWNILLNFL